MITDAFRLDDKVALVTGASKGIGACIASTFAAAGADVVLLARSETELQEVAESVEAQGRAALPLACDITDDEALAAALASVSSSNTAAPPCSKPKGCMVRSSTGMRPRR